jgi:hypothetical protein
MHRVAILSLCLLLAGCGSARPSHEELVAEFRERREAYETLRGMITNDALATVAASGEDFARQPHRWHGAAEIGLQASRAQQYRRVMRSADVDRIDRNEDGEVLISMKSWGMANRGWRVSAAWRTRAPSPLLANLDSFRKTTDEWEVAYAPLADNWYLRIVW